MLQASANNEANDGCVGTLFDPAVLGRRGGRQTFVCRKCLHVFDQRDKALWGRICRTCDLLRARDYQNPIEHDEREVIYWRLLHYFNDHGVIPDFELQAKATPLPEAVGNGKGD